MQNAQLKRIQSITFTKRRLIFVTRQSFKIRNFVRPFRLDLLLKTKQSNDSIKLCPTWNLITIVSTITFETRVNFSVVYVIYDIVGKVSLCILRENDISKWRETIAKCKFVQIQL